MTLTKRLEVYLVGWTSTEMKNLGVNRGTQRLKSCIGCKN